MSIEKENARKSILFGEWREGFDTDAEFAEALGISPSYLGQIKKGLRPITEKTARKFEKAMGRPEYSLDGMTHIAADPAETYRPDSNAELAEYEGFIEWDDDTPPIPGSVAVPFFTGVDLSAGNGSNAGEEAHGAKLMFARSTLSRQGVDVNNAVCVKVRGSSMEPALFDGSVVGVDTSATAILEGKMYAIRHYDELRVKYLYPRPDGGLRIVSVNKAEHPDEILTPDEAKHVTVIGRVFWSSTLY